MSEHAVHWHMFEGATGELCATTDEREIEEWRRDVPEGEWGAVYVEGYDSLGRTVETFGTEVVA